MEPQKKKAVILAALLGVLALLWGYNLFFSGRPAKVETAGDRAKQKERAAISIRPIKVDLDLLEAPAEKYSAKRNIFEPVFREPVLERPKLPNAQGAAQARALPPPPPPPPPKTPEQLARERVMTEIEKFKVLGFLKREQRTDVFFSLGDDYFVASDGEKITDNFYLDELGFDYLVIADKETGVTRELEIDFEGKAAEGAPAQPSGPVPAGSTGAVRGTPRPAAPRPATNRPATPRPVPPGGTLPPDVEDAMRGAAEDRNWPVGPEGGQSVDVNSAQGAAKPPAPLEGASLK